MRFNFVVAEGRGELLSPRHGRPPDAPTIETILLVKTGVQRIYNYSKTLDSGFRRNDGERLFRTFYDIINY